jgi:hypothetical protein
MFIDAEAIKRAQAAVSRAKQAAEDDYSSDILSSLTGDYEPEEIPAKPEVLEEPTWSSDEQRQMARLGINPSRLKFMTTLGNLMASQRMQQQMMQRALRGIAGDSGGGEVSPALDQYV